MSWNDLGGLQSDHPTQANPNHQAPKPITKRTKLKASRKIPRKGEARGREKGYRKGRRGGTNSPRYERTYTVPRSKTLSPEARREAIRSAVAEGFAKGDSLPAIRRSLSASLGGSPSLYLGTADPVYYRLVGEATPLLRANGSPLLDSKGKATTSVVRAAVRRRRDEGVRWSVLAASLGVALGLSAPVSEAEAKRLYASAGGDLEASYVGRGTRVGAPATYSAEPVETDARTSA